MAEAKRAGALALSVLALAVQVAFAQEALWETANAAGMKAYQEGRYAEAETQFLAALKEAEKSGEEEDRRLATSLNNLANLYRAQGNYAQAEPLYRRALAFLTKAVGPDHPNVATALDNYTALLRKMGRDSEAEKMEARAQAIRAKHAKENPTK